MNEDAAGTCKALWPVRTPRLAPSEPRGPCAPREREAAASVRGLSASPVTSPGAGSVPPKPHPRAHGLGALLTFPHSRVLSLQFEDSAHGPISFLGGGVVVLPLVRRAHAVRPRSVKSPETQSSPAAAALAVPAEEVAPLSSKEFKCSKIQLGSAHCCSQAVSLIPHSQSPSAQPGGITHCAGFAIQTQAIMSSKIRRSQNDSSSERNNMTEEPIFSLTCQVKKEKTKDSAYDPKKKPDTQDQGPNDLKKKLLIQVEGDRRTIEHVCSAKDTLYEALQHVGALQAKMNTQSGKELLVHGTDGIKAYIHPAMPLSCFPDVTHLEISFQSGQKENHLFLGQSHNFDTNCVKFYIHAVGKNGKRIVQCRKLNKQGNKLCIWGFKGETIKEALCRDGRFQSCLENNVWKLVKDLDSILESSQLVDDLEGKHFEVEFEKRRRSRSASAQNFESRERNTGASINLYPDLKAESEKFREYFEKEVKGAREKAKVHKFLYKLGRSVGYLSWDHRGKRGYATCFVFHKQFIFTCWHVIRDIVGEEVDQTLWAGIVSRCVKVSFGYEMAMPKEEECFSVDPWFEVADESLDYAVLKLKIENVQVPDGLYKVLSPAAFGSLRYIIGHPEGKPKCTESCLVIPQAQRKQECPARQTQLPFVHMVTRRSFPEISDNNDVIIYHSSFFFGASGSPAFNAEGSLVGMHAAGLSLNLHGNSPTLIEFGPCIHSILSHMEQNFTNRYLEIAANQDEEMDSDVD
ncbi:serine protease FAM111A-like [Sorex araneus]|uniref:serine protease FAM111A-like n=1 Tax=Sorex araneus TaxID=42254 RepID=UPI002433ED1E|nr:serine protease FAM111A-like [Sorex araneus]